MNVTIKAIRNPGDILRERLVLKVLRSDEIGSYAIFNTESLGETVSSIIFHSFWFPDSKVKAGDLVVLYTKRGTDKHTKNSSGTTTHFFYWGLDEPVWTSDNDAAVLLEISDWESREVLEFMNEEGEE